MKQELYDNNLVIKGNLKLKDALVAISDNQKSAIVVVDENEVLLGIASDGDIRRALVQGSIMESPISNVVNENSVFVEEKNAHNTGQIFAEHTEYTLIPIVGRGNRVVGVVVRS